MEGHDVGVSAKAPLAHSPPRSPPDPRLQVQASPRPPHTTPPITPKFAASSTSPSPTESQRQNQSQREERDRAEVGLCPLPPPPMEGREEIIGLGCCRCLPSSPVRRRGRTRRRQRPDGRRRGLRQRTRSGGGGGDGWQHANCVVFEMQKSRVTGHGFF